MCWPCMSKILFYIQNWRPSQRKWYLICCCCLVGWSMSDSLWSHGPGHARPSCLILNLSDSKSFTGAKSEFCTMVIMNPSNQQHPVSFWELRTNMTLCQGQEIGSQYLTHNLKRGASYFAGAQSKWFSLPSLWQVCLWSFCIHSLLLGFQTVLYTCPDSH